jgi:K+-sensing histidine kinase KdpD
MNFKEYNASVIIGSIVGGSFIAALYFGFMIKIFSFLFLTPLFTMKYIGGITVLKIFLVLIVCLVLFGLFGSLFKDSKKIKKISKEERIKRYENLIESQSQTEIREKREKTIEHIIVGSIALFIYGCAAWYIYLFIKIIFID